MAYESGVANTVHDLLDKLRIFAAAQGWTINRWQSELSGWALCIEKNGMFFNFHSGENITMIINDSNSSGRSGIRLNGSDGYSSGAQWDRMPGHPLRTAGTSGATGTNQGHCFVPTFFNSGPYAAYHFFTFDEKSLHCTFEITTGIFLHFGCGALDLFSPSAPGGGRYCYGTGGSYPSTSVTGNTWLGQNGDHSRAALELVPGRSASYNTLSSLGGSHLRAAFASFDNWCGSGRTTASTHLFECWQGGGCHDKVIRDYAPNPINNVGVLVPNVASVNRGDFLQPVGVFPGMRYMDMTNYLPGDEFTIGSDVWKVFPWFQKGSIQSYQRAIALLKVE